MTKATTTAAKTTTSNETKKVDVNPITKAKVNIKALYKTHETHSAVIRHLAAQGYERKHIATFLGKRYQHVRNVLEQDILKKAQKK